jgi:hypothetical protein
MVFTRKKGIYTDPSTSTDNMDSNIGIDIQGIWGMSGMSGIVDIVPCPLADL